MQGGLQNISARGNIGDFLRLGGPNVDYNKIQFTQKNVE